MARIKFNECDNCGKDVPDYMDKCPYCGEPMDSEEDDEEESTHGSGKGLKIILGVFAVAAILAVGILIGRSGIAPFQNASKNDSETAVAASQSQSAEPTKTQPEVQPKEALSLKEYGYMLHGDYLYYSVHLYNASKDYCIEYPSFRMTAKDENGIVLGTEDQTLSIIYPEQDFYYGFLGFECEKEPATFQVELLEVKDSQIRKPASLKHPEFTPFTILNPVKRDSGVLGEIKNNNDYGFESAVVTVVFRDEDGKLLGGDGTFVDDVPAGGTTAFEIGLGTLARGMEYNFEVYANIWP